MKRGAWLATVCLAVLLVVMAVGAVMAGEQQERVCYQCRDHSEFIWGGDLYFYSDGGSTQKLKIAGSSGNIDAEGTLDVAGASTLTGAVDMDGALNVDGNISSTAGAITVTDSVMLDGAADAAQLTVQAYTTQTNELLVLENSSGTDLVTVEGDGHIEQTLGLENVGNLPTIDSASVITTSTDGALWTVGASEIWFVYAVYCEITTNFDCDGNDCTLIIGDGNDTDGFLVLTDAEMQTSDAEFTGAPAGWKGLHTDSMGAYLSGLAPFVYDGTDTIDVDVGGTNNAAGAATCYIVYTRIQ